MRTKIATLNFRVEESEAEMLRELAQKERVSMTSYLVTMVRLHYKIAFPERAAAAAVATVAERLEAQILGARRRR